MEKIILNADIRTKEENLKKLRNSKVIPGIVYSHNQEPISFKVNNSELLRVHRKAWESTIVNLKVGKKDIEVLFQEIQRNPITWDFSHIDFYAITRWEKLTTKISLNFVWESPAKKEWAIIEEVTKELEIKCLPKNLVESFEVDLAKLENIWDSIRISDLDIDTETFEIISNIEDTVVMASEPAKAVIEEEVTEAVEWEEGAEWEETEENTEEK